MTRDKRTLSKTRQSTTNDLHKVLCFGEENSIAKEAVGVENVDVVQEVSQDTNSTCHQYGEELTNMNNVNIILSFPLSLNTLHS
jgi:hypothetical protein